MLTQDELKKVEESKRNFVEQSKKIEERDKKEIIEYLGKIFFLIDEEVKKVGNKKWSLKFITDVLARSKKIREEYKENIERYLKSITPEGHFKVKIKRYYSGSAFISDGLRFKIKRVA